MARRLAHRSSCAGLVLGACVLILALPVQAQRGGSGPFATLTGTWSGSGSITLSNGSTERLRCRAAYAPEDGGRGLRSNLRCASDSYRVDLTSQFMNNAGVLSGRWMETTRNATGSISGSAAEGHMQVRVEGGSFIANLAVVTRGDRQSITIQASGTDVREVSISLRRG
jgi:hypothetical protein